MFKKIALGILVLIVAILLFAFTQPSTFRVERSTTVQAPPEIVFRYIDDFRQWRAWSPWEKVDTAMQRTYSDPSNGTGATYSWEGNRKIGAGNMVITESTPFSRVLIDLNFVKPMKAHNQAEFTLEPQNGATKVTWIMHGENSYIAKVMCIFVNMDKMIGGEFEKGFADLKAAAEQEASRTPEV